MHLDIGEQCCCRGRNDRILSGGPSGSIPSLLLGYELEHVLFPGNECLLHFRMIPKPIVDARDATK